MGQQILVTGSRSIDSYLLVKDAIEGSPWWPDVIIHGGADGVDTQAHQYAKRKSIDVDMQKIPEWVWDKIGAKAGPMRNGYMVEQADVVVAVWDGESDGTKDAIKQAESAGLPVYKVVCERSGDGWIEADKTLLEDDQQSLTDFARGE